MAKNNFLHDAKKNKQDEFYTQYNDIQNEMNAYIDYNPDVFKDKTILLPCDDPEWSNFTKFFALNFERYGIKKLISTSYAIESKNVDWEWKPTLFESKDPQYDIKKTKCKGKIFTLDRKDNSKVDIHDLKWKYLEGDGDFRSEEVTKLRDEADIIITNPPFSLLREFVDWIMKGGKQFVIIGSQNAITYKEIFPLIQDNKMWLGKPFNGGNAYFSLAQDQDVNRSYASGVYDATTKLVKFRNCIWLTNIEHGGRHNPLKLMTMEDNVMYSKHKEIKGIGYKHYDNYDAIEVPYSDAIPSDYNGAMGVPISFLDKYCPEQFEIVKFRKGDDNKDLSINGVTPYFRILIKKKEEK